MRALAVGAAVVAIAVLAMPAREQAAVSRPTSAPPPRIEAALRLAALTYQVPYWQLRSVAWCESRYRPGVVNRSSGARGLFQFLPSTWRRQHYRTLSPLHASTNALAAARIVAREGWRQWSCKPR